jgi:sarcosine oxidase subunit alpha
MEAGAWRRPRHYGEGDPEACRLEEYRAVRERVGMIDVSTLGKIEVLGPDALVLLNLAYTGSLDSLAVGKTRYVLLCDQRGLLIDDGIAARLGDEHYYVTAGSGHVQSTFRLLTQIAALERLDVEVIDRTRVLSALNVAGPASRQLLQAHTPQRLDDSAFPFLGIRETTLFGLPVRLIRVGFVGETGFEVHARYGDGLLLWERLSAAGANLGLRPFGIETQRLLRLEKGHLIVGHDTDGVMHPFETPLGGMVAFSKPHFMGRAALEVLREAASRRVVAFTSRDPRAQTLEECHLAIHHGEIAGRITSVGMSPTLGCTIGLAVLERMPATGEGLHFRNGEGVLIEASQVHEPFYDPGNLRQREVLA